MNEQISNHIREKRQKILLGEGEKAFEAFAGKNIGKILRVLIEKVSDGVFSGWSENYLFCDETNFEPLPDQEIVRGKIIE